MRNPVAIEDIEEMRRREGIEDVALRQAIRQLGAGDFVKMTFVTGPNSWETLRVRITSIRGSAFRGKLADKPTSSGRSPLAVGAAVAFTTAHIHSLERAPPLKRASDSLAVIHPPSRRRPPSKHASGGAKTKARSGLVTPRPRSLTAPWTTAERLQHIEALGLRINGYVQFMCQAGNPNNASAEATERAALAFHEQMVLLESRLSRIHGDFKLE